MHICLVNYLICEKEDAIEFTYIKLVIYYSFTVPIEVKLGYSNNALKAN